MTAQTYTRQPPRVQLVDGLFEIEIESGTSTLLIVATRHSALSLQDALGRALARDADSAEIVTMARA